MFTHDLVRDLVPDKVKDDQTVIREVVVHQIVREATGVQIAITRVEA